MNSINDQENTNIHDNLISPILNFADTTKQINFNENICNEDELIKRLDFKSSDLTNNKIIFDHDLSLNEKINSIKDTDTLTLTDDNKNKILFMIDEYQVKLILSNLEENYNKKIAIVDDIMKNLHQCTIDVESIKEKLPKQVLVPLFNRRIIGFSSSSGLESFNKSTMSKGSQASSRSKMLGYKPSLGKAIIPKYTMMSPKVSINIAFGKKSNTQQNAQVEINLENDEKKMKTTKTAIKLSKDLDNSLNSSKSVKKNNNKKANLYLPGTILKKPVKSTSNNMNNEKISLDYSDVSANTVKVERTCNSNFKFEPKKKMQSSTKNSNITENTTYHVSAKNSEDINQSKGRNIPNSEIGSSTAVYKSIYKTKQENERKFIDFTVDGNIKLPIKILFLLDGQIKNIRNIRNSILHFLKLKDRSKLRIISKPFLQSFADYEIGLLMNKINIKKKLLEEYNPMKEISFGSELLTKMNKTILIISENDREEDKEYVQLFIDLLYMFFLIKSPFELDSTHKLIQIENNCVNKNCYYLFDSILDNLRNKQSLFLLIKEVFPKMKLNLLEKPISNISFKYYNDLFKTCKYILEENKQMEYILDCEIMENKIERIKNKFY